MAKVSEGQMTKNILFGKTTHYYCERIFDSTLQVKPVAVLSNNDGFIISCSQEAKNLGIPVGVSAFQIRDLMRQHAIQVFRSNYTF